MKFEGVVVMNNEGNKNIKTYIIIAVCCAVALVIGLFTGKAVAGKRKMAAAEKMVAQVQAESDALVAEGRDYWYAFNGKNKDNEKAEELFKQALEKTDNADAWYYLGEINRDKKNYEEAVLSYEKAMELGSELGRYALGYMYQHGLGVDADYGKAEELFKQAIDNGCLEANNGFGDFYQSGYGDYEEDGAKAIEYFEKAATGEEPDWVAYAYSSIAATYRDAVGGLEKDIEKAAEYYQKSYDISKTWSATPMAYIADMYSYEGEANKADEWYKKAADAYKLLADSGNSAALNMLGNLYYNGAGVEKDYGKAKELFEKAAEAGNADALYNIGWLYHNGFGVEQDYAKAMEWYEKAADAGVATAMYNIGGLYCDGYGVEQNYTKAMEWFEKAADAGDAVALNDIGWLYQNGYGVDQDYAKAVEWYEKAGDADAINYIAQCYFLGDGVEQDYDKALEYYQKAYALGRIDAYQKITFFYENKGDIESALEWAIKAKEDGSEDETLDNIIKYYKELLGK